MKVVCFSFDGKHRKKNKTRTQSHTFPFVLVPDIVFDTDRWLPADSGGKLFVFEQHEFYSSHKNGAHQTENMNDE